METLNLNIKKVKPKLRNYLKGYNLNLCYTCGTCASGCPISGMPGIDNMNSMKMLRLLSLGLLEEAVASDFSWHCTGCGRCLYCCPMNIDIPAIMATLKKLRAKEDVPWMKRKNKDAALSLFKKHSDSNKEYLAYLGNFGLELAEAECPGFPMGTTLVYDHLIGLIRSGTIKINKSIHKDKVFTFHDACKHGRILERFFGKGYYEEPRWLIQQCVDHYEEMHPNRANSHCCGAGGALWASNFEKESAYLGRQKINSIKNSKADVVVVACSKCLFQLKERLPKYYNDCHFDVRTIWDIVEESTNGEVSLPSLD